MNDHASQKANHSHGFFDRRAAEKDAARMSDYRDPNYANGVEKLFGGAIKPPQCGRMRF